MGRACSRKRARRQCRKRHGKLLPWKVTFLKGITAMAAGIDGNCRRCRRVISGLLIKCKNSILLPQTTTRGQTVMRKIILERQMRRLTEVWRSLGAPREITGSHVFSKIITAALTAQSNFFTKSVFSTKIIYIS